MISLSNTRRISMASTRCCVLSVLVLAFLWSSAAAAAPARRDHGALIALEVAGSYAEMGRQQAELLGEDLRRVYELQRREFDEGVATAGFGGWWMDRLGVPLWSWLGAAFEDSSFHEELGGLAEGLGVPRREVMRALLALGGGSTVFAATRSATVDG